MNFINFANLSHFFNNLILLVISLVIIFTQGINVFADYSISFTIFILVSHLVIFSQHNIYIQKNYSKFDFSSLLIVLFNYVFFLLSYLYFEDSWNELFKAINFDNLILFLAGLIFFCSNKAFLNFILIKFNSYKFYRLILFRHIILIVSTFILIILEYNFFLNILISEIILFLFIFSLLINKNLINFSLKNLNQKIIFGLKSITVNFISESLIKIDILMLAILTNSYTVSIYSIFSIFFEGVISVSYNLRNIYYKKILNWKNKGMLNLNFLLYFLNKTFKKYIFFYLLIFIVSIFLVLAFFYTSSIILNYNFILTFFIGITFFCFLHPIFFIDNVLLFKNLKFLNFVFLLTLTISIFTNFILINFLSTLGAIISSILTYLFLFFMNLYFIGNHDEYK